MPIYLGSTEMKPYRGSSEVSEMYLGSTLVYQNVRELYIVGYAGNDTAQYSFANSNASNNQASNNSPNCKCMAVWAVDLTDYNTINIDASARYRVYASSGANTFNVYGISTSSKNVGSSYAQSKFVKKQYIDNSTYNTEVRGTFTIDVSSYTGTYYLWVGGNYWGGGYSCVGHLYNIWLSV